MNSITQSTRNPQRLRMVSVRVKNWTAGVASVMALVCGFAPGALAQSGDPPSSLSLPINDMIWVWPGPLGDYYDAASVSCGTCYQTYRFMPDVSGFYRISTGGSLDSQLRVYNSSGTALTSVIDDSTGGESVTLTCTAGRRAGTRPTDFHLKPCSTPYPLRI